MKFTTLRAAREARGLTQAALAERCGVDQTTISKIEAGLVRRPAYCLVVKICRALGCTPWPNTIREFRCS